MKPLNVALISLFLFLPGPVIADIYRWVDGAGTVHFTDDITNIPAAHRGKATTIFKEAPGDAPPASPGRGVTEPAAPAFQPPSSNDAEWNAAKERNALVSEAEQLKAKISAKETLIKSVDDRQNLALNPLRARLVDPREFELYRKYQTELPDDRERLKELESRIRLLK
jgi:hypothetical protein